MAKVVWTEKMDKQAQWVPLDQPVNRVFKVSEVPRVTGVSEDKTDSKEFKDQSDQQDQKATQDRRVFKGLQVRTVKTET
jgi:hypothetical protein